MKNFDFGKVKPYIFPIVMGIVTIIGGINEVNANKRNEALEEKLDALNQKLEDKEEA